MEIKYLDIYSQYLSIQPEIDHAIQQVLQSTAFAGGPEVFDFENLFSQYCSTQYAVGVNSGTTALWMVLSQFGVTRGDKVITSPNTFFATAEAISLCGATPIFVDIDPNTYNIDPKLIEPAITKEVKAIIPVHIYGQMADMEPIISIAKQYDLVVIEDACQAHGAEYMGQKAGSMGDAGCFSFYPGKNLGAYGEAGAITTNNDDLVERLRIFRDHGQEKKYYHSMIGWNCRMDGLQGAVLKTKMKYLSQWTRARIERAELFDQLLKQAEQIKPPFKDKKCHHVYHVYAVQVNNRDRILKIMADKGITCAIHYPLPVHLQKAYDHLGYRKGDFPVAEKVAGSVLSLPLYPELKTRQVEYIAESLINATNQGPSC